MDFLHNEAPTQQDAPAQRDAGARLLIAPGAMGAMDTPFLEMLSTRLAAEGVTVSRFEFGYMSQRRAGGARRPPPRAEMLLDEYRAAVAEVKRQTDDGRALLIGGKSLGGRVASLVAGELFEAGVIAGLVCIGYPFHPPAKPDKLRTAHLERLSCPMLIIQGERDPFGTRQEVPHFPIDRRIRLAWIGDGDHDLKPRKRSGHTVESNIADAAAAVRDFARDIISTA